MPDRPIGSKSPANPISYSYAARTGSNTERPPPRTIKRNIDQADEITTPTVPWKKPMTHEQHQQVLETQVELKVRYAALQNKRAKTGNSSIGSYSMGLPSSRPLLKSPRIVKQNRSHDKEIASAPWNSSSSSSAAKTDPIRNDAPSRRDISSGSVPASPSPRRPSGPIVVGPPGPIGSEPPNMHIGALPIGVSPSRKASWTGSGGFVSASNIQTSAIGQRSVAPPSFTTGVPKP